MISFHFFFCLTVRGRQIGFCTKTLFQSQLTTHSARPVSHKWITARVKSGWIGKKASIFCVWKMHCRKWNHALSPSDDRISSTVCRQCQSENFPFINLNKYLLLIHTKNLDQIFHMIFYDYLLLPISFSPTQLSLTLCLTPRGFKVRGWGKVYLFTNLHRGIRRNIGGILYKMKPGLTSRVLNGVNTKHV